MKPKISVIILTLNEELNLERCLKSVVGLAMEIFVVDNGSTDRTESIARNYGAEFVVHLDYKNQAQQFNWALDNLKIRGDWVLKLDADEYLTPELKEEMEDELVKTSPAVSGLLMKRRVYFMGRWMKHGGYYPVWFLRLWRRGKGRSEVREMDEHIVLTDGEVAFLKRDFVDDNKNGLKAWTAKHNDYSSREAIAVAKGDLGVDKKHFYYRLPPFFRCWAFFIYRYFFRLGFLDGREGLIFHFLHSVWYRFLIDAKIWELKHKK